MNHIRPSSIILAALAMGSAAATEANTTGNTFTLYPPYQHPFDLVIRKRHSMFKRVQFSQRQRRKFNRQRHAAGVRNAFA